jgi:CHAD domain-containing protein
MAAITFGATACAPESQVPASGRQAEPELEKLLRVRVRKCMALLAKVLAEDDPTPIHDLRVWSRRLQQVIITLLPDTLPPEGQIMVKALRRARRSLGPWRDCDVLIELLEGKARRVRDQEERETWDRVRTWALQKRKNQMIRARRRLANQKLFTLPHSAKKLIRQISGQYDGQALDPRSALLTSVRKDYAQWRGALSRARQRLAVTDIHAFRIHTKRLRYRIELAVDLGDGEAQPALASLKTLQDELGRWHDQTALAALVTEALADPEFLKEPPRSVAAILRKMDHDHALQIERIRKLLASTHRAVEQSALHTWIDHYCGEQPGQTVQQPTSRW